MNRPFILITAVSRSIGAPILKGKKWRSKVLAFLRFNRNASIRLNYIDYFSANPNNILFRRLTKVDGSASAPPSASIA